MSAAKRVAASSSHTTSIASEILAGGQQLTVKDLQTMLNLSRNSVYKLIDAGEIETVMIAKSYRTTLEAVQRFLQRNTNQPKQPKRLSDLGAAEDLHRHASQTHAIGVDPLGDFTRHVAVRRIESGQPHDPKAARNKVRSKRNSRPQLGMQLVDYYHSKAKGRSK